MNPETGILLINLGTPDGCDTRSVRRYLREFLHDPRVIDLPYLARRVLVDGLILPFRPKQSAKAYREIWTEAGSPLLIYGQKLTQQLSKQLPSNVSISLGMRYGNPSIASALNQLKHCSKLFILPLFPQYSSAATGSAIEKALDCLKGWQNLPHLTIVRDFYQHPIFIEALTKVIQDNLPAKWDTLLLSYHGLPERHLLKGGCQSICSPTCPAVNTNPISCYRKQCYATSRQLQVALSLADDQTFTSFQSRLGKTPWIQPYTDEVLPKLYQQGTRDLVVACPSFVADCLETLEEIGMQAKEQWQALGGNSFTLVPCLNDDPRWVAALLKWLNDVIDNSIRL